MSTNRRLLATLRDLNGDVLHINLRDTMVDSMLNYWEIHHSEGPIVIILQYALIHSYPGYKVLENINLASRLFIHNHYVSEVVDFINNLNNSSSRTLSTADDAQRSQKVVDMYGRVMDFKTMRQLHSILECIPKQLFKFFEELDNYEMKLRNARGYTWDVTVEIHSLEDEEARLVGGWHFFVVDNDLDDDYSVVLSNIEKGFLDVVVFDGKGVARMAYVGKNEENVGTVEPGFELHLNKTAIERGKIVIPKAFWKEHVESDHGHETRATILGPQDRRWIVEIDETCDGSHYLTGCTEMIADVGLVFASMIEFKLQKVPSLCFSLRVIIFFGLY